MLAFYLNQEEFKGKSRKSHGRVTEEASKPRVKEKSQASKNQARVKQESRKSQASLLLDLVEVEVKHDSSNSVILVMQWPGTAYKTSEQITKYKAVADW